MSFESIAKGYEVDLLGSIYHLETVREHRKEVDYVKLIDHRRYFAASTGKREA